MAITEAALLFIGSVHGHGAAMILTSSYNTRPPLVMNALYR